MRQHLDLAHPLSDHIMISHYDLDPSLDLIHHQMLRCIFSLDQAKHQKPITCIFSFDITLHNIFITCALSPFIFSSLYTQILCQYLGPKPLRTNTLDQILRVNTSNQIPWTKYLGSIPRTKIPWTKYLGPKPWFSNMYALFLLRECVCTYMLFLFYEPACIQPLEKVNLVYSLN